MNDTGSVSYGLLALALMTSQDHGDSGSYAEIRLVLATRTLDADLDLLAGEDGGRFAHLHAREADFGAAAVISRGYILGGF